MGRAHRGTWCRSFRITFPTNREKWDELLESVACLAAIVDHPVDARAHVTVQQNVDNLSFAKAALEKIHLDYARWLDRTSLRIFGALPCPGEPAADFIFVGDSSMALVQAEAPPEGSFEPPKLTRRNIGEFIKADPSGLRETAASVQYGMRWGKGLEQTNDEIESSLNCDRRRSRERRAPAIIVVSYAGNDVWGKHGFVGNTWIDSRSVRRNPAVQRAASEWQDELARRHFAQLERMANFLTRPDVGAISIIAYTDANSFGLHQDFARQMCLFGDAAQDRGLLSVTGAPLTRATTRYDGFHAEDSDSNRTAYYRYYVAMARLTYQMWRLKDCEALRKQARIKPVVTSKDEKARAEAEAKERYRASYVFLEPRDRFPENKITIEPNLCKTCMYPDGHEVALLDEITGEHLKATPEELERAGIIVPQGTGEPTVDVTSSPERESSVNDPVEDDFVPDYDPDDEPHPTQKTTLLAEPTDSCPDEKLMSVTPGRSLGIMCQESRLMRRTFASDQTSTNLLRLSMRSLRSWVITITLPSPKDTRTRRTTPLNPMTKRLLQSADRRRFKRAGKRCRKDEVQQDLCSQIPRRGSIASFKEPAWGNLHVQQRIASLH